MRLYRGMVTRLYTHPVYLEHITPSGHPERPDRLRAIARVLEDERFAALDRETAPLGEEAQRPFHAGSASSSMVFGSVSALSFSVL